MSSERDGLRSMTGFGRGEASLGSATVWVELRSVNSRFLEVRARLPRDLALLEARVRARVACFFCRGKVDLSIRIRGEGGREAIPEVDLDAASQYLEGARALGDRLGLQGEVSLATLLGLPGVARLSEPELEEGRAESAVLEAVEAACARALEMRRREGAALGEELRGRLGGVESIAGEIEARADQVQKGVRARLEKRLAALAPETQVDPARLAQEVVLYCDRMDVTEETVRLRSHAAQFREALQSPPPVGRKLEFLLQEIGREVNTIGSKAADAPLSRRVVDLKTELEKLREQVLNLE